MVKTLVDKVLVIDCVYLQIIAIKTFAIIAIKSFVEYTNIGELSLQSYTMHNVKHDYF